MAEVAKRVRGLPRLTRKSAGLKYPIYRGLQRRREKWVGFLKPEIISQVGKIVIENPDQRRVQGHEEAENILAALRFHLGRILSDTETVSMDVLEPQRGQGGSSNAGHGKQGHCRSIA